LERKLSISQAYADAVKQAHDKLRQGGSHVETSGESASVDLSANYAQVGNFYVFPCLLHSGMHC